MGRKLGELVVPVPGDVVQRGDDGQGGRLSTFDLWRRFYGGCRRLYGELVRNSDGLHFAVRMGKGARKPLIGKDRPRCGRKSFRAEN